MGIQTAVMNADSGIRTKEKTGRMSFREFCVEMFKVGCIGFGGGNALVPVMDESFIRPGRLNENEETYDKDVISANLTPGALPVEIAGGLGLHNFGIKGMLLAPVIFTLPGLLAACVLLIVLSSVHENYLAYIDVAAVGVAAFIIALLSDYITTVFVKNKAVGRQRFYWTFAVIGLVFFFTCGSTVYKILGLQVTSVFSVTTIHMLAVVFFVAFWQRGKYDAVHLVPTFVLSGIYLLGRGKMGLLSFPQLMIPAEILMIVLSVYGFVQSLRETGVTIEVDSKGLGRTMLIWLAFVVICCIPAVLLAGDNLMFLLRDLLSTWMSFGGGDAYLTIADGMFVETGYVSESTFYSQIITIVNVLPGSILCKTLFGIGYYIGFNSTGLIGAGILVGIAAFACSVGASCTAFFLIYYLYDGISKLPAVAFISRWIRPIVCGLLIKVMLSLCNQGMKLDAFSGIPRGAIFLYMVILGAANIFVRKKFKVNVWFIVLADIVVTFVVFLVF